jgi:hypothetical protein
MASNTSNLPKASPFKNMISSTNEYSLYLQYPPPASFHNIVIFSHLHLPANLAHPQPHTSNSGLPRCNLHWIKPPLPSASNENISHHIIHTHVPSTLWWQTSTVLFSLPQRASKAIAIENVVALNQPLLKFSSGLRP